MNRSAASFVVRVCALGGAILISASAGATAKSLNPCSLVNVKQVQSITHLRVSRHVEAPLGPTCIYTLRQTRSEVTLSIGRANFTALTRRLGHPQRVMVGARIGYCGGVGDPILYVSLPQGKVLTISASCAEGRQIAKIAVGSLHL